MKTHPGKYECKKCKRIYVEKAARDEHVKNGDCSKKSLILVFYVSICESLCVLTVIVVLLCCLFLIFCRHFDFLWEVEHTHPR